VRVLGLHLDPKLQWKKHKAATLSKMATHTNALCTRLAGSTWDLPMLQARQVYTMVIRPAMAYAALAWHQPASSRDQGLALTRAFQKVQNKCLHSVTGGYKATPIQSLETLAHVPPLHLYLTSRVIAYRARARNSGVDRLIEKACTRIKSTLGKPQVCTATAVVGHPRPVRGGWAKEWVGPRRDRDPPSKPKGISGGRCEQGGKTGGKLHHEARRRPYPNPRVKKCSACTRDCTKPKVRSWYNYEWER
jgi:hypothetical protein